LTVRTSQNAVTPTLVEGYFCEGFGEELGYPPLHEVLGRQVRIPVTSLESLLADRFGKRPLPASVSIAEDERQDALRVEAIELLREDAAPRQPEYLRAFDVDDIEEPRKTPRPICCRELLRRLVRRPRARRVPSDHPEPIREMR
jgi:hypothetical protein